jgi:hypothetical protein
MLLMRWIKTHDRTSFFFLFSKNTMTSPASFQTTPAPEVSFNSDGWMTVNFTETGVDSKASYELTTIASVVRADVRGNLATPRVFSVKAALRKSSSIDKIVKGVIQAKIPKPENGEPAVLSSIKYEKILLKDIDSGAEISIPDAQKSYGKLAGAPLTTDPIKRVVAAAAMVPVKSVLSTTPIVAPVVIRPIATAVKPVAAPPAVIVRAPAVAGAPAVVKLQPRQIAAAKHLSHVKPLVAAAAVQKIQPIARKVQTVVAPVTKPTIVQAAVPAKKSNTLVRIPGPATDTVTVEFF